MEKVEYSFPHEQEEKDIEVEPSSAEEIKKPIKNWLEKITQI